MATLEQIGAALKKAHAAGDAENARKLAAAYQAARASAAGPASVPDAPPESAAPGSRAYADWAMARVKAGKDVPQVGPAPPEDFTHDLGSKFNAAYTGAVEAVPIAGPALLDAAQKGRAFFQGVPVETIQKETDILQEANPGSTLAGQVTGTVAPFVLASTVPVVSTILGMDTAAPLGMQMIAGAGSSKVISELDTLARGGDPNAVVDIGGVEAKPSDIAGIAGAAGPVVGMTVGKLVEPVAKKAQEIFRPAAAAESAITEAARTNRGASLSPADEALAAQLGVDVINADRLGPAGATMLRTVSNVDPGIRVNTGELLDERFATQNDVALDWVRRNTGAPTDKYAIEQTIANTKRSVNDPAYKAAYSSPAAESVWNDDIADLMAVPEFQSAIKEATGAAVRKAATRGEEVVRNPFKFSPDGSYELVDLPGGGVAKPSLKFWDYVQRDLREQASVAARQGRNDLAADLTAMRDKLNASLDAAVPEFLDARTGAAKFFKAEDAFEAGQKFTATGLSDLPEAEAAIKKFSPVDRKLFASGFAIDLINKIGAIPENRNTFINKIFTTPESRAQIELALGPAAAKELESLLRIQNTLSGTRKILQGGSDTTAKLMDIANMVGRVSTGRAGAGYGSGAAFGGLDPSKWSPTAWAAALAGAGGRMALSAIGRRVDANVMREMARLLTSNDPKLIDQAIRNATRSSKSADALKAIEYVVSSLTKSSAAGGTRPGEEPTQ